MPKTSRKPAFRPPPTRGAVDSIHTIAVGNGVRLWVDQYGDLYFSFHKDMVFEDSDGYFHTTVTRKQAEEFFIDLERLKWTLIEQQALCPKDR